MEIPTTLCNPSVKIKLHGTNQKKIHTMPVFDPLRLDAHLDIDRLEK